MWNPNFPNIPPPGASNGGDAGARAAGFADYSDYQNKKSENDRLSPQYQQQQAQQKYQAGIDSAVLGLQSQGTSLDAQYKSLLNDVLGQGTVAMNTVTGATNEELARRGITNNSYLYGQEMGSAQLPVQVANQTAVGSLGFTEAQLQNALAANIASLKAGGAGTAAELPLSYGSLALANAANIANIGLTQAQTQGALTGARYVSTPYGLYDTQTNQYVTGAGNLPSGGQVVNQNGQYYLSVP